MKIAPIVLGLLASQNPQLAVHGFVVVRSPSAHRIASERSLWVDEQSYSIPPLGQPATAASSLEARVRACLAAPENNIPGMMGLLEELEALQNACTEEGNQTLDECDVTQKDARDAWKAALEARLTKAAASAMVAYVKATQGSLALKEEVMAYLSEDSTATTAQMEALVASLEALNYDCTEEGNQTNEECDVTLKEERDSWIKQLEAGIQNPSATRIRARLDATTDQEIDLGDLTRMVAALERETDACTEEGNQTNEECDVWAKADREDLLLRLEERILARQAESARRTNQCLKYSLCDTAALQKTLRDLEALGNLCTEEGNQTRSFCSLEAKAQRDDLAARLEHELDLAQSAITQTRNVYFQI